MKEIYEAPELELKKFLPEQKIALIEERGIQDETYVSDSDIELIL